MNDLLQLKGQFQHNRAPQPGPVELPSDGKVTSDKLRSLANDLYVMKSYWSARSVPFNPLISVYYKTVVAKSNRIRRLLSGTKSAASSVVGAKFEGEERSPRHIITHCVDMETIDRTIELLERCAEILDSDYDGSMDRDKLKDFNKKGLRRSIKGLTKTAFAQCMRDACYVNRFGVEDKPEAIDDVAVVTLYDTGYADDVIGFMHDLGFTVTSDRVLGNAVRLELPIISSLS